MVDWVAHATAPLDGIEAGVDAHEGVDYTSFTGTVTPDRLDYPCLHIVPQTMRYEGGNEYRHVYDVRLYYEISRNEEYRESMVASAELLADVMDGLADEPLIHEFKPTDFEFFRAQDQDNNLLNNIQIRLRAQTMASFAADGQ